MGAPISPQPKYTRSASVMRNTAESYIADVLRRLFERYVLNEAQSLAAAAGLPDKWIEGLEVAEVGWNEFHLVNTFAGEFGEPLAQWFEEGTKRNYPITPKVEHADVGQYTDRDLEEMEHGDHTIRQHPPVLAWHRDGEWHFRRKVIHPGIEGAWVMKRAVEEGTPKVQEGLYWFLVKHPEFAEYDVGLRVEMIEGAGQQA